jgi:hypothetical protein
VHTKTGWKAIKMAPSPFVPNAFYEDIRSGELLYSVGQDSQRIVFDASLGQRIVDLTTFSNWFVQVNPADSNYRFSSVRSSDFFNRVTAERSVVTQRQPKCTPQRPLSKGLNESTFWM